MRSVVLLGLLTAILTGCAEPYTIFHSQTGEPRSDTSVSEVPGRAVRCCGRSNQGTLVKQPLARNTRRLEFISTSPLSRRRDKDVRILLESRLRRPVDNASPGAVQDGRPFRTSMMEHLLCLCSISSSGFTNLNKQSCLRRLPRLGVFVRSIGMLVHRWANCDLSFSP